MVISFSIPHKSFFYQLVIRINRSHLYDCALFNTQSIVVNTDKGPWK